MERTFSMGMQDFVKIDGRRPAEDEKQVFLFVTLLE